MDDTVNHVEFLTADQVGLPGDSLHQSAAARFGDFAFLSGIAATDENGAVVPDARPVAGLPFHSSSAALQAEVVLTRLATAMEALDGSLENGVYIEQYFTSRTHFEPYRTVGRDYLPDDRPPSTALPCRALSAEEAVLEVDFTAMLPADGSTRRRISTADSPQVLGGYAQGVRVGDWIFLAGATPADHTKTSAPYPGGLGTAVAPDARTDPNMWYGSPIERQTEYIMTSKQAAVLEAGGSSIDRIVKADVYLSHPAEDLRGFHTVWKSLFGDAAPATTVVPIDGFGSEGSRIEIGIVALADDAEIEVERLTVPALPAPVGPYPHAVRAGDLLFVSTLVAGDEDGLVPSAHPNRVSRNARPQVIDELEYCFSALSAICSAAGTKIENVLRRKNFYTDLSDLFAADEVVRSVWPDAAPASTNVGITGPHVVPGARVALDVIAAVSG
jgi:enamine deaminase RidA (YjgF/YER057c/UK114 family)